MMAERPTSPSPTEANPYAEILFDLQPIAPVVSARRVSEGRDGAEGRAPCARVHLLGPVRGDAVLPAGPGTLVARDLRRAGQLRGQVGPPGHRGAASRDPGVRERAPPLGAVPRCVSGAAGTVSSGRRGPSVPLQEQAALAGCHR